MVMEDYGVRPWLAAPEKSGTAVRRAGHALVVRSSADALPNLTDALEALGLAVREVSRGVEAVAAARHLLPDLIVLDTQLRDAPGREVAAWLRSHPALRATPIVLLGDRGEAAESQGSVDLLMARSASAPDMRSAIDQMLQRRPSTSSGR
jgi:CheY-like chemotaxis protein